MDVTSLLNSSAAAAAGGTEMGVVMERRDSIDQTPTPSATGGSTPSSSVLPTPSPDKTPPRRSNEPRAPLRNRTPWDAGGYSLPLTLDAKLIRSSPAAKPAICCESPTERLEPASPKSPSPRHKFSDSRSSLSSYTTTCSSNTSVSHSRFSSLSTVSEYQPLISLITDFSALGTRISDDASSGRDCMDLLDSQAQSSPTPVRLNHDIPSPGDHSPRTSDRCDSPSDAILITRNNSTHELTSSHLNTPLPRHHSHTQSTLQPGFSLPRGHKRAVSAPDFPSLTTSSFNPRFPTFGPIAEPTPPPSLDSDHMSGDNMEPSLPPSPAMAGSSELESIEVRDAHNAAAAAAAAALPTTTSTTPQSNNMLAATVTTTTSAATTTATVSPAVSRSASAPSGSPLASVTILTPESNHCMAPELAGDGRTCDLSSNPNLRKVISHIFGRNKLCTRMIPDHVWVRYCRKHYQRNRYRNGAAYGKEQCVLIKIQIDRVMAWSDDNKAKSQPGVVKDWTLSVRKRELKRLEKEKSMIARGKKRSRSESDDDASDDSDADAVESGKIHGHNTPAWLRDMLGDGYSAQQIKDVVDRLLSEIRDDGSNNGLCDVEILPRIITEEGGATATGSGPKKTHARRKSLSQRRSAASTAAAAAASSSSSASVPFPPIGGPSRLYEESHAEKRRRRLLAEEYEQDREDMEFARADSLRRGHAAPGLMHNMNLPTRPRDVLGSHGHLNHHHPHDAGSYYSSAANRGYGPPGVGSSYATSSAPYGRLSNGGLGHNHHVLAPLAQRATRDLSMAQHLESNLTSARRPNMHGRSQSEIGFFNHSSSQMPQPHHAVFNNRPTSSSGFAPSAGGAPNHNHNNATGYDAAHHHHHHQHSHSHQQQQASMSSTAPSHYGSNNNNHHGQPHFGAARHAAPENRFDGGSSNGYHSYPSEPTHAHNNNNTTAATTNHSGSAYQYSSGPPPASYAASGGDTSAQRHMRHQSSPIITRADLALPPVSSSSLSLALPHAGPMHAGPYRTNHGRLPSLSAASSSAPYSSEPRYHHSSNLSASGSFGGGGHSGFPYSSGPSSRRASQADSSYGRPSATPEEHLPEIATGGPTPVAPRVVLETDKTKDLYSSRR